MQIPGSHVFGYVLAESGVGEHTRLLIQAIQSAGLAYQAHSITATYARQEHPFDQWGEEGPYPINVIGVNADELPRFLSATEPDRLVGQYNIGLWAWELEEFPPWLADRGGFVDEVWANSSFSAKAIEQAIDRPVFPFPLPVAVPQFEPLSREALGLPEEFLFMFCFDFDSRAERKNPLGVVRAFTQAFRPNEGPQLVIKTVNGPAHSAAYDALLSAAGDRSDIEIRDGYLADGAQKAMLGAADCYVSLHRAEGFGLTLAEAMALGRPVIGTAYSGNLDFMTEENSYLVPFDPIPIPKGADPYPEGVPWADPDVGAAASLMRQVFDHPEEARERGIQGSKEIVALHGVEARGRFIRKRFENIGERLTAGYQPILTRELLEATKPPGWDPSTAIQHLIETGPDFDAPSRFGGLTSTFRRAMYRLLQNYDQHQRRQSLDLLNLVRLQSMRIDELERQIAIIHRNLPSRPNLEKPK